MDSLGLCTTRDNLGNCIEDRQTVDAIDPCIGVNCQGEGRRRVGGGCDVVHLGLVTINFATCSSSSGLGSRVRSIRQAITNAASSLAELGREAVCRVTAPLQVAARASDSTVGAGIGGSAGGGVFFGIVGGAGVQVLADPQRNVAVSVTVGGSSWNVWGLGAQGGFQGSVSDVHTVDQLKGLSYGGGVGVGPVSADFSVSSPVASSNNNGQLTVTVGAGQGLKVSFQNAVSYTWVPSATTTTSFPCHNMQI
jgi:hypothetical protein